MTAALKAAQGAARKAAQGESDAGARVMAYYDVLDVAMQQVSLLGLELRDQGLARLNPDELLYAMTPQKP